MNLAISYRGRLQRHHCQYKVEVNTSSTFNRSFFLSELTMPCVVVYYTKQLWNSLEAPVKS